MKLFIKKLFLILLGFYIFAEILSRIFHISTDAPKMYQNSSSVRRYFPDQEGYWVGAHHKWYINELGFPGKNLPNSYDNLVTIIGASNIENFMNPDSCRQTEILRKLNPNYNYLGLSMAGTNLLDAFELIKEIDTLNPYVNLIHVEDGSFIKSIKENSNLSLQTQFDLKTSKLFFSNYQESPIKNILYNFKFAYYLYRKNLHVFDIRKRFMKPKSNVNLKAVSSNNKLEKTSILLDFINRNYRTDNVVLIFNDVNNDQIYKLVKSKGIQAFRLDSQNDKWTLNGDAHWSCYGHYEAAKQVSSFLESRSKNLKF